jgi:hypothetical protein
MAMGSRGKAHAQALGALTELEAQQDDQVRASSISITSIPRPSRPATGSAFPVSTADLAHWPTPPLAFGPMRAAGDRQSEPPFIVKPVQRCSELGAVIEIVTARDQDAHISFHPAMLIFLHPAARNVQAQAGAWNEAVRLPFPNPLTGPSERSIM